MYFGTSLEVDQHMINPNDNPVQWALLVEELNEAKEHLEGVIMNMISRRDYDETYFQVDMGHIMAHLNRAWSSRNHPRELTDEEWEAFREYPKDLQPIA
jgi:hypothetical protein